MINLYKLVKQFLGGWHNKKGATYEATDQPSETGVCAVLCCVLCLVELQLNKNNTNTNDNKFRWNLIAINECETSTIMSTGLVVHVRLQNVAKCFIFSIVNI